MVILLTRGDLFWDESKQYERWDKRYLSHSLLAVNNRVSTC